VVSCIIRGLKLGIQAPIPDQRGQVSIRSRKSDHRGLFRWLLLFIIFAAALSVRAYNIDGPPLDFHPTRQYRSYLLARAFYDASSSSVEDMDKAIALAAKPALLEPPITELIASFLYRIFGGEDFIIPRSIGILFCRRGRAHIPAREGPRFAGRRYCVAAFFLFLPIRSQGEPELSARPLMIMMFTASIYAVYNYYVRPSRNWLVAACVLSGIAVLVKPVMPFLRY
jgi:hypothetical protein